MRDPETSINDNLAVYRIEHELADVWIGRVNHYEYDYAYGGTRMVPPGTADDQAFSVLSDLAINESLFKNQLINRAIRGQVLSKFDKSLPGGFAESYVGGARCIIRPRHDWIHSVLRDPQHPDFIGTLRPIFSSIGDFLNDQDGMIKLTPDFGRYSPLSDVLHEFTPHVLGVRCEIGGCGGKTSYTTSGVAAAFEQFGLPTNTPVTVIGAAGSMGSEFLGYLQGRGFNDVAVSDIAYDRELDPELPPEGLPVLRARPGAFTDDCLRRRGVIVATTWGRELENSDLSCLRPGTDLLLAHNMCVPAGPAGVHLARNVADRQVCALPGQVLTIGGALTARLEWFWRQAWPDEPFGKPLAHDVVRQVVAYLTAAALRLAESQEITPYEAARRLAD